MIPHPTRRDYEGHTFGEWTVLHRVGRLKRLAVWRCRCSCGAEHDVLQPNLVSGQSARCRTCSLHRPKPGNQGEGNGAAKLTEAQVRTIRSLKGEVGVTALGRRYGVSHAAIIQIHSGKTWKHVQ